MYASASASGARYFLYYFLEVEGGQLPPYFTCQTKLCVTHLPSLREWRHLMIVGCVQFSLHINLIFCSNRQVTMDKRRTNSLLERSKWEKTRKSKGHSLENVTCRSILHMWICIQSDKKWQVWLSSATTIRNASSNPKFSAIFAPKSPPLRALRVCGKIYKVQTTKTHVFGINMLTKEEKHCDYMFGFCWDTMIWNKENWMRKSEVSNLSMLWCRSRNVRLQLYLHQNVGHTLSLCEWCVCRVFVVHALADGLFCILQRMIALQKVLAKTA